ncbi:unnamed protein product [Linum trigynum]|uniref:Uncharacterized protein n=1 Tax=Linum trigynum TaxID=586398 RepID=A0AAV2E6J0_9ROSI
MKASTLQLDNRILHHMLAKSYTPAGDSASTPHQEIHVLHLVHPHGGPSSPPGFCGGRDPGQECYTTGESPLHSLHHPPGHLLPDPTAGLHRVGGTSVFREDTIKNMHLLRVERGVNWIEGFPAPQIPAED